MSRAAQVLVIIYFLCAGVAGAIGMIYARYPIQFWAALGMSVIALYALCMIRRYEKAL